MCIVCIYMESKWQVYSDEDLDEEDDMEDGKDMEEDDMEDGRGYEG